MDWSRDDYRELNRWMNQCRKEASKRHDRATAQQLTQARGAMANLLRSVSQIKQAREKVAPAVDELTSAPDSQHLLAALTMAEEALHGTDVRRGIRSVPRDMQQPVMTMVNSACYLPQEEVDQLTAQITQRKNTLQETVGAERETAVSELEAAKKELAALPNSSESLPTLDRLEKLAALQYVDPAQAQAFRRAVQSRRREITLAQQQQQQQRKVTGQEQLVADAIEKLKEFEVKVPKDLGNLYEHGRSVRKQLKAQGVPMFQEIPFNEALSRQQNEGLTTFLPAFRKWLAAIPSNKQGISQVGTGVADFTATDFKGIERVLPALESYRAATLARLQKIMTEIAKKGGR